MLKNKIMKTATYEIKKGRKWFTVRASSMKALNQYCKENGYTDWRMVGMQSRAEMIKNANLEPIC